MSKEWAIHREAAREIDQAVAWYEEKREGLGAEFLERFVASWRSCARSRRRQRRCGRLGGSYV